MIYMIHLHFVQSEASSTPDVSELQEKEPFIPPNSDDVDIVPKDYNEDIVSSPSSLMYIKRFCTWNTKLFQKSKYNLP